MNEQRDIIQTAQNIDDYICVGRKQEICKINDAYDRLLTSAMCIVTVAGEAGIGKTYLIEESIKYLSPNTYIYCKSIQNQKKTLGVIADVIDQMIECILTLPTVPMQNLTLEMHKSIGEDLDLLISISPSLGKVIRSAKAISIEDLSKLKYRIKNAVVKFINIISKYFFPLVINIDDLQWTDELSMGIISTLINKKNSLNILLLLSYRNNEIKDTMKKQIEQFECESEYILLEQLSFNDVKEYISLYFSDNLHNEENLAKLVYGLTSGNPFYMKEIIKILIDEKVINYSYEDKVWHINNDSVRNYPLDENIETIIKNKLHREMKNNRELLKTLVCLDGKTEYNILKHICKLDENKIKNSIASLIDSAIVVSHIQPNGEIEILFTHDIIHKLIQSELTMEKIQSRHYEISNNLLEIDDLHIPKKDVFIVSHLLRSPKDIVARDAEKWIGLLFNAGMKERQVASIEYALTIFKFCEFLLSYCEQVDISFVLKLRLEIAECLCICKKYEECDKIIQVLLDKYMDKESFIMIKRKQLYFHHYKREHHATIEVGKELLNALGLKTSKFFLVVNLIKAMFIYTTKRIESIHAVNVEKDERIAMIIDVLVIMNSSASITNNDIKAAVGLCAALVAAKDSQTSNALMGYASYAYVLFIIWHDLKKTKMLVDATVLLAESTQDSTSKSVVYFLLGAFLSHWSHPINESDEHLQMGMKFGELTGDVQFLAYCTCASLDMKSNIGNKLSYTLDYINMCRHKYSGIEQYVATYKLKAHETHILSLKYGNTDFSYAALSRHYNKLTPHETFIEEVLMLQRAVLFEEIDIGYEALLLIDAKLKRSEGLIFRIDFLSYGTIIAVQHHKRLPSDKKKMNKRLILRYLKELEFFSDAQHDNFFSYYMLAFAEYETNINGKSNTLELYSNAIQNAKNNKNLKLVALGNLLAARSNKENESISQYFAEEAIKAHMDWGADFVAKKIERDFSLNNNKQTPLCRNCYLEPVNRNKHSIADFISSVEQLDENNTNIMFLETLLRNDIADYGAIIYEKDQELCIKYEKAKNKSPKTYNELVNINYLSNLSHKICRFVQRTGKELYYDSRGNQPTFLNDSHITDNLNLNILCLPMVFQNIFIGLVYIEKLEIAINHEDFKYIRGVIPSLICNQSQINELSSKTMVLPQIGTIKLTKREVEVLTYVAQGLTNDELSERFNISLGTVKRHMSNILHKLNVDNRIKAIVTAKDKNII